MAPPTRWVGESGVIELGMRGLEGLQLLQERVELGVGDLRRVEDVVGVLVAPDVGAERRGALSRGHVSRNGPATRAALGAAALLAVAREDVLRQRQQRVLLRGGRERRECCSATPA